MKPSSFLSLYEKLERLVQRLPESLQQPIIREITPIKTLFLLQRPPRIVLLGADADRKSRVLEALFGEVAHAEVAPSPGLRQTYGQPARGTLRLLDAQEPAALPVAKAALTAEAPDLLVFVRGAGDLRGDFAAELEYAAALLTFAESRHGTKPRLLGVMLPEAALDVERARLDLQTALHTRPELSDRIIGTLALTPGAESARLAELIALELPGEAQLEMARLSRNRVLQKQIAQVVIKSMTAICGAIGTQPIPLADFPILTSLQATMVAGIMHISGREMSVRLAGEFTAALGANLGLGLVLREGSRAVAKLVPFWGNAVSGAVAAGGTYAVGRAAVGYFIEGISLPDARALFRNKKKEPALIKN